MEFSSRGGEVNKPDVVAPGASTSTVPNWGSWDRFWGTSMASPYTAGVMSLLMSAAKGEYPDVKVPAPLLYKAVRESAVKIDNYTDLDQGGGYINVDLAYEILKKYIEEGEINKLETYTLQGFAPNMPNNNAPSIYIRNGSFLTGNEKYSFSIVRNNFIDKEKFYRLYSLHSDAEWVQPVQKNTYLRNDQITFVNVDFDIEKMQEPGLYTSTIKGIRKDGSKFPEFELLTTVVMPFKFGAFNNYRNIWEEEVAPGMIKRYFIDLPAGGTCMQIKLESDTKQYTNCRFHLHAPDGRAIGGSRYMNSFDDEKSTEKTYFNLEQGVYEVIVEGSFRASDTSGYTLTIEFDGINVSGDGIITQAEPKLTVTNLFDETKALSMKGSLLGYKKEYQIMLDNQDRYEIPFVIRNNEAEKTFEVKVSKEDFNKVTDFAVEIHDENGKALEKGGLTFQSGTVTLRNNFEADSTSLKLVLLPAFADELGNFEINVDEITDYKASYDFPVVYSNYPNITLYPKVPKEIMCQLKKPNNYKPKDSEYYGEIKFTSRTDEHVDLELPVTIKF
jgi:hypothetical protein